MITANSLAHARRAKKKEEANGTLLLRLSGSNASLPGSMEISPNASTYLHWSEHHLNGRVPFASFLARLA